jgi:hypothetical protein
VVNDPPRVPRRAGALAPLLTALLAKDPTSRPSGAEVRAELGRLAGPRPSPTEVLPVQGPGRTVPLPAAATPPVPGDATPVPSDAEALLAGSEPDRVGPAPSPAAAAGPAGAGPAAAAGGAAAAAGSAEAESAVEPSADAEAMPEARPQPDEAEAGQADAQDAPGQAGQGPVAQAGSAPQAAAPQAAAPSSRAPEASAFEPAPPASEATREPRPLLPPAPAMDRGGRGRMVGVVALLAVLGLAAVLFAVNLRSGGDGDPTAATTAAPAGGGGNGAAETTSQATSTTQAPSTTSAPTTAAAGTGLPEGWTAFTNRRGANRVGVPPGFRAQTRQRYNATVVQERDDPRRVFTVRSTNPANPLPEASRVYRDYAAREFQDFREVRYQEDQTYAGHKGAVVFEYEAVRNGRRVHVSHINFKGRTWGYNVEFIAPAGDWGASRSLARQFEQAFQALG